MDWAALIADTSAHERFFSKIEEGASGECWEWTGARSRGYGNFRWKGKSLGAHRVARALASKESIPPGTFVLHTCDNPGCCNPAHLRIGSHTDNMQDMFAKGRRPSAKGEQAGRAKLTEAQVAQVRSRYAEGGVSKRQIAGEFGVSHTTINHILNGKTWVHTEEALRVRLLSLFGNPTPVLDHGHVALMNIMGGDQSIVRFARTSYGDGTKTAQEDRGLIRYLLRNKHTSPFESCVIALHIKAPIFVARQWYRHRTGSYSDRGDGFASYDGKYWSMNEVSARYSVLPTECYVPPVERIRQQSKTNKQGSGEGFSDDEAETIQDLFVSAYEASARRYRDAIEGGVAREIARVPMAVGTYTEFCFQIDLHNLFHFLRLRLDSHAQEEIRVYAEAIAEIVKAWVPYSWEAFESYMLYAEHFSQEESDILRELVAHLDWSDASTKATIRGLFDAAGLDNKRERGEFLQKLALI